MVKLAYILDLSPNLCNIHLVFHVYMLRRYEPNSSYVIDYSDLIMEEDASYAVTPLAIFNREENVLRRKVIPLVKVVWKHNGIEEKTWEREVEMREKYPFFIYFSQVRERNICNGRNVVTP